MDSEEERTPRDVEFARELGRRFTERLLEWRVLPDHWFQPERSPRSATLLTEMLGEVREYYALEALPELPGSEEATHEFRDDIERTIRQRSFARDADLGGLLAVRHESSGLDGPMLVDLFNPRARRALFGPNADLPALREVGNRLEWRDRARTMIERAETVTIVGEYEGLQGFLTSFADSLRTAWKWLTASRSPYVHFTVVKSNTRGYALECYPQYQYSPQAFGSVPTWPVDAMIRVNHYRFQGYLNGQLAKDPRTHFAGPNSPSTWLII